MSKKIFSIILVGLFALVLPLTAQSEGIPLQKDVLLGAPIFGPEDLPEEITFTLYDSQTAATPLGYQTFTRGQYTVDFEFSKSNGITAGNVARVSADFTKTLNLKDAEGEAIQPKEIWAGIEVGGAEIGDRTKVSDGTLVQLLLASDASIATYLTLAYTGDSNPIATIYKDLPISSLSSDGSKSSLSNYFSAVVTGASEGLIAPNGLSGTNDWFPLTTGSGIYYNYGTQRKVGIGTTTPDASFEVMATAPTMGLSALGYTDFFSMFGGSPANQNPFFAWRRGPLRFGTATSPAGAGWSEKVRIMSNGKVGIGTTTPGAVLEVNATAPTMGLSTPGYTDFFSLFGGSATNQNPFFAWKRGPLRFGTATSVAGAGWSEKVRIMSNGNVGIGTTNPGTYDLAVEGKIGCRELVVTTAAWADFVFEKGYRLPSLSEVEKHIQQNGHLPGIPNATQVKENGVSVGEVSARLLQKIEELTLYVIDINKENQSLKAQLANLEAQMKEIKN